jgi:sterol desaturase/sphingolipid hydroxylase (fatty acid hydroxylase superfamily)
MAKNFVSNKDESARLFKSDFMEFLSHVHWSVPVIVYTPVVAYCLWQGFGLGTLSVATGALWFLFGIFVWTFTEYVLHRFVFHYQPTSEFGKYLHFMMHGVHHDYPSDSKRLVLPPAVSIPLSTLFFFFFSLFMSGAVHLVFFGGFMFGYVCYDEIHYATHHAPLKSPFWLKLKHHHIRHHFLDPYRGYGVSSPLWDLVFGTQYAEKEEMGETA